MREVLESLAALHGGLNVKGKKTAYLAMNGNMFAFVDDKGGLCLRFSQSDKAAFNEKHKTSDVIQYNAVMQGYVRVPDQIVQDRVALEALFAACVEHAETLKAKPTKRK